jgi:hypothetical protein
MAHQILLLNFSEKDAQTVTKAGYQVERGFLGRYDPKYFAFQCPHPIYEYDVLFYNSNISAELKKEFPEHCNLVDEVGSYQSLQRFDGPPHVRVSFVGEPNGATVLLHGGVPFVELSNAEENVSSFVEVPLGRIFAIQKIHDLLTRFKGQIAKVNQFFTASRDLYPFNHFAVLISRSGKDVVAYGTTYEKTEVLRYVLLPQLKDNASAVVLILQCLEKIWPELFPEKTKRDWLQAEEFKLPDEIAVQREIEEKIGETMVFVEAKKKERDRIIVENSFVRRLLVATEDSKIDPSARLSGVVKRALEFLEFRVVDIDEKVKSAIRKEDFWVIDEDFFAITEVTGTVNKNPKIKEFNDILGRITTIYKRTGQLALPTKVPVSGLLVLNYDIDNHPNKRPRVYTGEDEAIVETAIEQGIGLLSTVELHKIIVDVKENHISKSEARAILRKPGRIEF